MYMLYIVWRNRYPAPCHPVWASAMDGLASLAQKVKKIMREKAVEQYLGKRVEELGGRQVKLTSPGNAGEPDRLIKLPDFPAALLELKRPGQKPRPLQWDRIGKWLGVGMLAGYASTFAEVDEFLDGMRGGRSYRIRWMDRVEQFKRVSRTIGEMAARGNALCVAQQGSL